MFQYITKMLVPNKAALSLHIHQVHLSNRPQVIRAFALKNIAILYLYRVPH